MLEVGEVHEVDVAEYGNAAGRVLYERGVATLAVPPTSNGPLAPAQTRVGQLRAGVSLASCATPSWSVIARVPKRPV